MIANVFAGIEVDEAGVARIGKTRIKVVHLVLAMKSWSLDANGLRDNYPELSMADIHAALAYYYEHQEVFDQAIQKDMAESDLLEDQLSDPEFRAKLVTGKFGSRR